MDINKCRAYFERIGLTFPKEFEPNGQWLKDIQYAHCITVPYENLDILEGKPLSLDPDALYNKIVKNRRGGYCFEVNGLLGWLLEELGYGVTHFFARYLRGENSIPMRRHRVLKVEATDGVWLVDVGIGEVAPRVPVRLVEGEEQPQFEECYRLDTDEFLGWVLMDYYEGQWRPFYSFTEEEQLDVDYTAASFYCEKHPDSPFNKAPMLAIKTAEGRVTIDGNVLKIVSGESVQSRVLNTPEEVREAYKSYFFLEV
ncbi:MAG: arylamine N-acetyltransferase [Lachnospiraceae bacterium]|nr:arylamine N-acetyltransferase [Lachnospiraceae bacterium]